MTEKLHPNVLTLLRILLLPLPCILLAVNSSPVKVSALGVLILLAFTDYLDGAIARRYQKVSSLGTILDPIADKIFVTSIYLVLVHLGYLEFLPVALIVLREVLVSFLRIWFPEATKVQRIAKIKTSVQMGFAAFVIVSEVFNIFDRGLVNLLVWMVVGISYLSSFNYFLNSFKKLAKKDIKAYHFLSSGVFLLYPVFLLLIFPASNELFWIPILVLDLFFFRKALGKSSPKFALKDNWLNFIGISLVFLEDVLLKRIYFSLWLLLGISILKDGFRSLRFIYRLLVLG